MKKSFSLQILTIMLVFIITNIAYAEETTDPVVPKISVEKSEFNLFSEEPEYFIHK